MSTLESIPSPRPYARTIAATPHNSIDEAEVADGWMVTTAGTISFVTFEGTVISIAAPTLHGTVYPYRVRRVNATGTTAAVYLCYSA